ncbi:DNA-(apurinic or apyrimidinic site) endonuclease [Trichinella pseudospiralis]
MHTFNFDIPRSGSVFNSQCSGVFFCWSAGTGWRHLVIAVWCFDGSIGQYDGEFFFLVAQAPVLDLTVGQFVDPCFG